jgi:hypothetical protein
MNAELNLTTISPQRYARAGGVLYLIIIAAGIFGELLVRSKLVIPGDAAATAHQIIASSHLYRGAIAGDLLMHICDIPLMLIFYFLLKPVSRPLSLLALFFNIAQTAILAINKLTLIAVLSLLESSVYGKAFDPHQIQALSYLFLDLHENGFGIGLIFFGCRCLIVGYLIYRSGYFPKILGILQFIAGVCYLVNSFALILSASLAAMLFPVILLPAFFAELAMALWLLIKGVRLSRWNAQPG